MPYQCLAWPCIISVLRPRTAPQANDCSPVDNLYLFSTFTLIGPSESLISPDLTSAKINKTYPQYPSWRRRDGSPRSRPNLDTGSPEQYSERRVHGGRLGWSQSGSPISLLSSVRGSWEPDGILLLPTSHQGPQHVFVSGDNCYWRVDLRDFLYHCVQPVWWEKPSLVRISMVSLSKTVFCLYEFTIMRCSPFNIYSTFYDCESLRISFS